MKKAILLLIMFLLIPVSVRFDSAVAAENTVTAEGHDSSGTSLTKGAISATAATTLQSAAYRQIRL